MFCYTEYEHSLKKVVKLDEHAYISLGSTTGTLPRDLAAVSAACENIVWFFGEYSK